ncbi:MAG: CBS domain-containing protein [Thermomicrobiales bacterium]
MTDIDLPAEDATPTDPTVDQIMSHRTNIPIVGPDDAIAVVARTLADNRITGVPVIEDGKIIGIITETDLIAREADVDVPTPVPFLDAIFMADAGPEFGEELRKVLAVNARQIMTAPVFNIKNYATLNQAATLMIDEGISTIPVVNDDLELVGIVTRSDIVGVIARLENEGQAEHD